ncbi:AmmeMemoRadiSam system radical SAM enzyme, partial [archaeon]|nr:AmmeMemoRadiSam system radical SAM enzyme [archaeon]
GKLYSLVYGRLASVAVDPVEKKPLYNFMPGTNCLSIATLGCNFACRQCQNYEISQADPEKIEVPFASPEEVVRQALDEGCEGIAYTYIEPTIFFEYAFDIMKLARKKGLYNAWVTNGYMNAGVVDELKGFCDASNIDLKGDKKFYEKIVGGANVDFVKENIRLHFEKGIHIELTNLIIPGLNDKPRQLKELVDFVASVSKDLPLHFSRFFPAYKLLDVKPTELAVLEHAYQLARKAGLKYVYVGNAGVGHNNTYCPECASLLIERKGHSAFVKGLKDSACMKCGFKTGIER